jgi:GNAT superfamily N-acetyltransferase
MEVIFGNSACWCQYWRQSAGGYGRGTKAGLDKRIAEHRKSLRAQLKNPSPPGMLAYVEHQPVGWCGFGPRSEMIRLVRSRTIPAIDDLPVWSIVCFLIRVGYRRRGVARALLRGAIQCAREYHAPALEAYPIDPGGTRIDVAFGYVGILSMFEQEGFQRIVETSARSAGLPRWLMRLDFTTSA